jgi:hypothetical protein
MKKLKTYKQLFEDNWTSDIEEKQYFLDKDGELDYDKWYKTWTISKDERYTKLTSKNTGWFMFEFPQIEPDWDESPVFCEISWEIEDNELIYEDPIHDTRNHLPTNIENMMSNYIMFHLLKDEQVKLDWFINVQEVYFTEKLAMKYDNLFDYIILLKEADRAQKTKKFNL